MDSHMQSVFVASGEIQAQQVRSFLEAAGIATYERGEALRKTHGLTVDGLGAVEILVEAGDAAQARELLDSAEAGDFRIGNGAEEDR
jgi:predicted deacylase